MADFGVEFDALALKALCDQFRLELVILFGSRTTGTTHAESDTDVGVVVAEYGKLSPAQLLELQFRLSQVIKPGQIDLVDLGRASGLLRHIACEKGRLLFEGKPGAFARFRVQAWNQFQDERMQIRRFDSEALRIALRYLTK
jgi:predicted nucleotidyltransferase